MSVGGVIKVTKRVDRIISMEQGFSALGNKVKCKNTVC